MKHNVRISKHGQIYNNQSKLNVISQILSTNAGKTMLASTMSNYIRNSIQNRSLSSKIFDRQPNIKTNKSKHSIVYIRPDGSVGRGNNIWAGRVIAPTFEIFSNPTLNISDIKKRRFTILERYKK